MTALCPLCKCASSRPFYSEAGGAYVMCAECSLVFLASSSGSIPSVNDNLGTKEGALLSWFMRRRCARILSLLARERPTLLDVGCGSGRFLQQYQRYGRSVGVEISEPARRHARSAGLQVFASLAEVRDTGLRFDLITFWHVLEHIDDPVAALRESAALLNPGGTVFISVPNIASVQARFGRERWAFHDHPHHLYEFNKESLSEVLDQAALIPQRWLSFSVEYGPFGWLQTLLNRATASHNFLYYVIKRGDPILECHLHDSSLLSPSTTLPHWCWPCPRWSSLWPRALLGSAVCWNVRQCDRPAPTRNVAMSLIRRRSLAATKPMCNGHQSRSN